MCNMNGLCVCVCVCCIYLIHVNLNVYMYKHGHTTSHALYTVCTVHMYNTTSANIINFTHIFFLRYHYYGLGIKPSSLYYTPDYIEKLSQG